MRDAIVRAAIDLLLRGQYEPSLDEIAATVGITRAQVHVYFTSSTAIEMALIDALDPGPTPVATHGRVEHW